MPEPFQNTYHRRAVADSASKPCFICYKPTSVVLVTPCNKDFFYVCSGHLVDRGFAIPAGSSGVDVGKQAEERRRQDELSKKIEKVKQEYEERQQRRKAKGKNKGDKDEETKDVKDTAKDEEERDAKIKKLQEGSNAGQIDSKDKDSDTTPSEQGPRIFNLHKSIYLMRTNRIRQAQVAKRDRETVQKLGGFPTVPKGNP